MDQEIRQRSVSRCLHLWSRKTELNLLVVISALEGGTTSNYYQGVWIVLRKTSSWLLRPPDQSLRSVISGWVGSLLIRDHSSIRVLLHFPSHSGNRPPAAVTPASWPGPGGWSHLPFVPFWLPIGIFFNQKPQSWISHSDDQRLAFKDGRTMCEASRSWCNTPLMSIADEIFSH